MVSSLTFISKWLIVITIRTIINNRMERGGDREWSLKYFLLEHVRGDMCQTTKNSLCSICGNFNISMNTIYRNKRLMYPSHASLLLSLPSPLFKSYNIWPDWCGSVDWVPACEPKGCRVWFPVRAHAWVEGQVPSRGRMRSNHTLMFLSLFPSV